MKILIYADNHFCERSSIISRFGTDYTVRLENQIKSINWAENLAEERGCQYVICLGDFFDKPSLTQDELTALRDLKWASGCAHYFLVGNHESEEADLHYSSTKALEGRNRFVISEPKLFEEPGFELAFLPYIVESNRRPVSEYFKPMSEGSFRILCSHNDLFGIQMGPAVSSIGFKPEELAEYCSICFNGHLHNGQWVIKDKVLNLGNLTGKDFGEDAYRYPHRIAIVDTDKQTVEFVENPHAFNFYKIDIVSEADLVKLTKLKNNAVIQVRCLARFAEQVRQIIAENKSGAIIESRLIIIHEAANEETAVDISDLTVDQHVKFAECCRACLENSEILEQELAEILK